MNIVLQYKIHANLCMYVLRFYNSLVYFHNYSLPVEFIHLFINSNTDFIVSFIHLPSHLLGVYSVIFHVLGTKEDNGGLRIFKNDVSCLKWDEI